MSSDNEEKLPFTLDLSKLQFDYNKSHHPQGNDLFARTEDFAGFIERLKSTGLFLYNRKLMTPPGVECVAQTEDGTNYKGLNFASADYLGLSQSEASKNAAIEAAKEFGVNSCGSPLALGGHKYYYQFIEDLQKFWGISNVMLFSAGWLAGFGAIKGLVKANDHIVMDELCHNCLIEGARASTNNIHKFKHLDNKDAERVLAKVRKENPENGILVITEGLFSMDADTCDLDELQKITKKHESHLMIDTAHDFGCMGPTGKGTWEGVVTDMSNVLIMGGGSKCLSTNLGFIGCNSKSVIEYMKVHCTAYMFTNAVNPIQCNTAIKQLEILGSDEGKRIRQKTIDNYIYARKKLESMGYQCIGKKPCPILIIFIGNELHSRVTSRLMMEHGVHVNGIEYPVVGSGKARLRLNIMPQHVPSNIDKMVTIFDKVYKLADKIVEKSMQMYAEKLQAQAENSKL